MLILIAGITGNIGQHAARWGVSQGHQIRGLGRSPEKLRTSDPTLFSQLESFIISTSYHDTSALERACSHATNGQQQQKVDAIICAYAGLPELHLDAQLLLVRTASRHQIKRFLAASWNYDWRRINFGDEPVYDPAMAFHRIVELSVPDLKPLHIFSGMLAEVFFGVAGQDGFTPRDRGVWDPRAKSMDVWWGAEDSTLTVRESESETGGDGEGEGEGEWNFTTEEDAGRWAVEVVVADGAENGGFISLCSWSSNLKDVAATYEKVRGQRVTFNHKGSLQQLEAMAIAEKKQFGYRNMWDWHRLWFLLFSFKGTWNLTDLQNEKYANVRATSLAEFLVEHPEI